MSQKENQEPTNPAVEIEDLTVYQDRAAEVKGGPTQGRGLFSLSTDINGPTIR